MTQYYTTQPATSETIQSVGVFTTIIRMDVRELTPEELAALPENSVPVGSPDGNPSTLFAAEEIEYNHREPLAREKDRAAIITAIVRAHYNADEMEAILNNYLLDQEDADARAEFEAMQEWRRLAKAAADSLFLDE